MNTTQASLPVSLSKNEEKIETLQNILKMKPDIYRSLWTSRP